MNEEVQAAIARIEGGAHVILAQLKECADTQTMLERIAYAAAIIGHQANTAHAKLNSSKEVCHG